MIDFSMDEMLELARQAELQKRVEADDMRDPFVDGYLNERAKAGYRPSCEPPGNGLPDAGDLKMPVETSFAAAREPKSRSGNLALVPLPEDLRGKLGEADEAEGDGASAGSPIGGH